MTWESELEKHREQAYNKGFEDGNKIADKDLKEIQESTYDVAYNKGVEDFEELFMYEDDYEQFFEDTYGSKDPDYNLYDLVAKYGAKKVVDDFKKWQEEKKKVEKEIKVGDEVKDLATDNIGVVMSIGKLIVYITNNGVYTNTLGSLEKTGRHFDEVEQMLDKLRGLKE